MERRIFERIRQTLDDDGVVIQSDAQVVEAISAVLHHPGLTPHELELLEGGGGEQNSEWMAEILDLRLKRAYLLGIECARRQVPSQNVRETSSVESYSLMEGEESTAVRRGLELLRKADPKHARALGRRLMDSIVAPEVSPEDHVGIAVRQAAKDDDPLLGTLFHEKYRIIRCLGRGGFGAVYEAIDERGAQNSVAIKVMLPGAARTRVLLEAFRGEAVRVTRLSHPNIVDWKTFDQTPDGRYYFVMELLEGEELDGILSREGALAPKRGMDLMLQILGALRAAHLVGEDESILHLDLKPRNIIVLPPGRSRGETAKVIDFGIGQYVGGEESALETSMHHVELPAERRAPAQPGGLLTTFNVGAAGLGDGFDFKLSQACTPEYASPEQCVHIQYANGQGGEPKRLDSRADIYSFGVLAYEMLTGRLPYARPEHRHQYLSIHIEQPIHPWTKEDQQLPKPLRRFVERCLRKSPVDRWEDTQEAFDALTSIVDPQGSAITKFLAPVILVMLVFGVVVTRMGASEVEALGLLDAQGRQISEGETIFLGPQRPDISFSLDEEGQREILGEDAEFEIRGVPSDSPLDGWTCQRESRGLLVSPPSDFKGFSRVSLRIWANGGEARSQALEAVWVGEDSWGSSVTILQGLAESQMLNLDLLATPNLSVDVEKLDLVVQVRGVARAVVGPPIVTIGEELPKPQIKDDTAREVLEYRYSLAHTSDLEGPQDWSYRIEGPAGRAEVASGVLTLVNSALSITSIDVVETGGETCRNDGSTYLVLPGDEVDLRIKTNRISTLSWASSLGGPGGELKPAMEFSVPIRKFPTGPGAWSIAINAEERDVHGVGTRHAVGRDVSLSLTLREESPEIYLKQADSRLEFGEGWIAHGNAQQLDLFVRPASMGFKTIDIGRVDRDGTEKLMASFADTTSELRTVHVDRLVEGENTLFIRIRPQRQRGTAAVERATYEQRINILLDSIPPVLTLETSSENEFLPVGESEATFTVTPAFDGGSRVDWEWAVWRLSDETRIQSDTGTGIGSVPLSMTAKEFEGEDGRYELRVSAVDLSGNTLEAPLIRRFERALDGPSIDLDSPRQREGVGATPWKIRGTSLLRIKAYLSDPNGIGAATCHVYRGDHQEVQSTTEDPSEVLADNGAIRSWTLEAPFSWAGRDDLYIEIHAVDTHGAGSEVQAFGPFSLAKFERPRPAGVRVGRRDGSSVHSMRLVRGNRDQKFSLGGESARHENGRFREAGMAGNQWVAADSPLRKKKPWGLEFERGMVADYYLDEREVSVGQYLQFLEDRERGYLHTGHWPADAPPDPERLEELLEEFGAELVDLPATGVSLLEANAYAHWAGKRLPTLLEHQYATRGGAEYRPYASYTPGENGEDAAREWTRERPRSCMGESTDVTPDTGILDLACNVSEWTQSPYLGPARRSPGSFLDPLDLFSANADRYWVAGSCYESLRFDFYNNEGLPSGAKRKHVGFRCAVSATVVLRHLDTPGVDPEHHFQGLAR